MVVIKDFKIPKNCFECLLYEEDLKFCIVASQGCVNRYGYDPNEKPLWCPLFDIPDMNEGKWERHNTYHGDDTSGFIDPDWRCSECGRQANVNEWLIYDLTDFCPNCGAKMKRGEE